MKAKEKIYEILDPSTGDDLFNKIFDIFIVVLILLNVAAVFASSFDPFYEQYKVILDTFELISVIIFTAEYLLRLFTANYLYPNSKVPYIKFIFSVGALIDLAAILPFYLPFVIGLDLRFLRVLRILRMLRVFKLGRYSEAMSIIVKVLKKEKEKLFSTIALTIILISISATIMYYAENPAQPEVYSNILDTTWWAISIFTTVWYGDYYPITTIGKLCGGVISLLGIMLIALPSGIICSGFMDELYKGKKKICPHCGKEIEEE